MRTATERSLPIAGNSKGSITHRFEFRANERDRNGPAGAHAKRVLVVDDDPTVRALLAQIVERAGFGVDTAGDGEEAWQALNTSSYDLVITDFEMPRLNGLDLIERLRGVATEPPCILISGNPPASEAVLNEIVSPGVFLAKPFRAGTLIENIYALLLHGGCQAA